MIARLRQLRTSTLRSVQAEYLDEAKGAPFRDRVRLAMVIQARAFWRFCRELF